MYLHVAIWLEDSFVQHPISRSFDRCLAGHAPPLVPRGLPYILKDEEFMGFQLFLLCVAPGLESE